MWIGFSGAKKVGVSLTGNALLRLNKDYALGSKGTVLEIPQDRVIYEHVSKYGFWELEECKFLARSLEKACADSRKRIALLDIGANTGLITLQTMNLSKTSNTTFLFEPIPRHISAIKKNLFDFSNLHLNEFALSDRNKKEVIFTDRANFGNTSLFKSVVPEFGMISTTIQLVDTTEYSKLHLKNFDGYVIKCDTQGMDALILSRFPTHIWENCESAVIEVWALDEISKADVDALLAMCQDFEYVGWHSSVEKKNHIGINEVRDFWLSKSGTFKNLFLCKNI